MRLNITKRSGKPIDCFDLPETTTIEQLKDKFYAQTRFYPERQRFTKVNGTVVTEGTLAENGLTDNATLYFKDLGVQISWRLVFVLEYFGPLLIAPIFFLMSKAIYGEQVTHNLTQKLGLWLMIIHFVKRELETLFVHRFSHGTMPFARLPINCLHYWILCGLMISYFLFHPYYQAPFNNTMSIVLAIMMVIFEFLNMQAHLVLRNLRPRGSKVRAIPHGWGFDLITSANYWWETCAWFCYALMINTLTGWLFLIVAFAQMAQWAIKKQRNYIKEFKEYPRHRKAIVPFLL